MKLKGNHKFGDIKMLNVIIKVWFINSDFMFVELKMHFDLKVFSFTSFYMQTKYNVF